MNPILAIGLILALILAVLWICDDGPDDDDLGVA